MRSDDHLTEVALDTNILPPLGNMGVFDGLVDNHNGIFFCADPRSPQKYVFPTGHGELGGERRKGNT